MAISIIILAAGKGRRMYSDLPKALHKLAGKTLLEHVVDTAQSFDDVTIYVVVGHAMEKVQNQLLHLPVIWVEQSEQLGTGHAVLQVLPMLQKDDRVLILCCDVPLMSSRTLSQLLEKTNEDALGWITAEVQDPYGLGRIIRDGEGRLQAIVEEKDATKSQKEIHEINTGICLIPAKYLLSWLPALKNNNAQKEYYLTDIFSEAIRNNIKINTVFPAKNSEIFGVNSKKQLAELERIWQKERANHYMQQGLTLLDPERFDVRGYFTFGHDVTVDINVIIEGEVSVGNRCTIGPNTVLRNVVVEDDVEIKANCVIEDAVIGIGCVVGPFARVRPGTKLAAHAKIGNFVEVKKSEIGEGSKVNHLSYIGDATIGKNVNIGAGTITCNYDGVHKHHTTIEDEAFIGSNTQLVAPVTVGNGATVGAGSTITVDVPPGKLTVARAKPVIIEGWERPKNEDKDN